MTQTDKRSIDAIAVSGGPGSYTGLRIGSATAKGLGMALDIPLIHVPTLDAMAYNAYGYAGFVCPIMDEIPVFKDRIDEHFKGTGYEFAPASMNRQRAASVAVLGEIYYNEGKTEAASEHLPDYLRLSQAERELNEKRAANG